MTCFRYIFLYNRHTPLSQKAQVRSGKGILIFPSFFHPFIRSLVCVFLLHSCICSFVRSFVLSVVCLFILSFVCSFFRLFVRSFVVSCFFSCSFVLFTYIYIYILTFVCLFVPSFPLRILNHHCSHLSFSFGPGTVAYPRASEVALACVIGFATPMNHLGDTCRNGFTWAPWNESGMR